MYVPSSCVRAVDSWTQVAQVAFSRKQILFSPGEKLLVLYLLPSLMLICTAKR